MEYGRITGAGGTSPEGQLQGIDGVDRGVDGGQNDNLVVAVSACGGAGIPIKIAGAAVRRGAAHVGIAEIGGAVVEVMPAGNLRTCRAVAGGKVFEAVGVRQAVDESAGCAGCNGYRNAGIYTVAEGTDREGVVGIGSQIANGESCVVYNVFIGTIADNPSTLVA